MSRRTTTQRDYAERILRVLLHIQQHLDDPLDLERLAALAHFSPFHFHRVFRGMVGEPVKAHLRRLRLERAALRLKHGRVRVTELAFGAGYETPEAFSRAFRARFGVAPSEYRDEHLKVAPSGVYYSAQRKVEGFTPLTLERHAMDARIRTLEPLRVAFVRHTGPYEQVGAAWQRLCAWAGPQGLLGPHTRMLGVSYDDPDVTPPEKLRYDACLVVGADVAPTGDIGVRTLDGGQYAVTTHVGAYTKLNETYGRLVGQWIPAQGLEPASDRPSLEFYLNDPQRTPEDQLRTDVYMPLRRNG
jgi:AraC family transcriptional regulator